MKKINLFIGGQYRDFYFGLGFLGTLLEKSGLEMHEIDAKIQGNPFKWIPEIMFHSLAYGYIRENRLPDFDVQNVVNWIDEDANAMELLKSFNTAFKQSLIKDVPVQPNEDVKKKVTKK